MSVSPDKSPSEGHQRESLKAMMARRKKEISAMQEIGESSTVADPYANATTAKELVRKATGIIYDLETLKHKCEWDELYPENPQRLTCILDRIFELGLLNRCVPIPNYRNEVYKKVTAKHSSHLFNTLKKIAHSNTVAEMEPEAAKYDAIYFNKYTFDSACRAVSCVLNLVRAVAQGEYHNGIALVRPPGHHAMHNSFCGYCYFNNVAVAANTCIQEGLASKILIIDYDVHHGQGTQQMFYHRKDVLYFSIHRYEHGTFWPNLVESNFNFIGKGDGLGYNINVPLNETGLTDEDYLAIVFHILLPVAYEFNPDLIIVSGGYDSCMGDEKGRMNVTPGFYAHLITLLSGLAKGKIAVCLEGGYFLPSLAEGVAMTIRALLGDPCPILEPFRGVRPSVIESINNVKRALMGKWKCFSVCETTIPTELVNSEHSFKIGYFGQPDEPPFKTRNCYPLVSLTDHNYYCRLLETLRERYSVEIDLPISFVYDDKMLLHKPKEGEPERPEKPERLTSIMDVFVEFGLDLRCVRIPILLRDFSLYNVHNDDYVETVGPSLPETKDVYVNEHSKSAVQFAVSGLLVLVDSLMTKTGSAGVAIIRPPGHHAEYNKATGFCLHNNVAIAANYCLKKYEMDRVLIVDFDVHHGNGTQNIFYNNKNVLYISIHRYDDGKFFPVNSPGNYTHDGFGTGKGYNINIPFSKDKMGDSEYIAAFHNIILPVAYSYAPQIAFVSAGFDAGINDPLGGYQVSPETFGHFIQMLKPVAGGKLILSLEGGYNLTTTSYSMAICTKALLGDPLPMPKNLFTKISPEACQTIRDVANHFKKYWPVFEVERKLSSIPILCKRIDKFTEETFKKDHYRVLDIDKVEDSAYVVSELEKFD